MLDQFWTFYLFLEHADSDILTSSYMSSLIQVLQGTNFQKSWAGLAQVMEKLDSYGISIFYFRAWKVVKFLLGSWKVMEISII